MMSTRRFITALTPALLTMQMTALADSTVWSPEWEEWVDKSTLRELVPARFQAMSSENDRWSSLYEEWVTATGAGFATGPLAWSDLYEEWLPSRCDIVDANASMASHQCGTQCAAHACGK